MSEDAFPLPGSSYKELCKIIAAYSATTGPSSPLEVSKLIGVHSSQVSRSNKFLLATGIVEGGQKKQCTPFGAGLGRAIHFDQTEVIADGWRQVYSESDFLQKVVSSIRIRKGMEESSLLSHIVFTSGGSKNGFAMAGAGAIIEILKLADAIEESNGTLTAIDRPAEPDAQSPRGLIHIPRDEQGDEESGLNEDAPYSLSAYRTRSALQINLNINCSVEQLDGLGEKLRRLKLEFDTPDKFNATLNVIADEAVDSQKEE